MRLHTWAGASLAVALAVAACGTFGADEPAPVGDVVDAASDADVVGDGQSANVSEVGSNTGLFIDPGTGLPPGMVKIEAPSPFFIDAREASVGLYNTVQNAHTWASLSLPEVCHGNAHATGWGDRSQCSTRPSQGVTTVDALPANCVDWCDALAFCVAQGKRLCGKMGGEPFPASPNIQVLEDQAVNATDGEWTSACAGPSENNQPYGEESIEGNCNDSNAVIVRSGEFTACEGSVPGLYDMSGNLNEWEAACLDDTEGTVCLARGGSYRSGADGTGCLLRRNSGFPGRTGRYDDVGIRCCADIPK